jgi:hypothetical protein
MTSHNQVYIIVCIFRRVPKIAKIDYKVHVLPSSVCPSAWNSSAPTERILMKLDMCAFFENLLRKFKFQQNLTRTTGTLHEDVFTFMTISRWILLKMRNVLDKSCRENKNTHFMFNNFFPKTAPFTRECQKCGAWGTTDVATWGIREAYWISKATRTDMHTPARPGARTRTQTHTCNISCLSTATMVRERASMLRYTYTVCLV